mmetsp:Transcript_8712/g.17776  ORF Transcript_8712/g.17776 Transcript_8712/m.17776 type:complete len:872 (-) Transcript_8712:3-2618(-)
MNRPDDYSPLESSANMSMRSSSRRSAKKRRGRPPSGSRMAAVTATAAAALVSMSTGAHGPLTPVEAFAGGRPLPDAGGGRMVSRHGPGHGASATTTTTTGGGSLGHQGIGGSPVHRRSGHGQGGRSRRHCPPRPDDERVAAGGSPPPPPLRMAVTDPETLLGEEMVEWIRKRGPFSPSSSSSSSSAADSSSATTTTSDTSRPRSPGRAVTRSAVDAATQGDPGRVYFGFHQNRALAELGIELDGAPPRDVSRTDDSSDRAMLGFDISPVFRVVDYLDEGEEDEDEDEPSSSSTHTCQIIESDLEVVEQKPLEEKQQEQAVVVAPRVAVDDSAKEEKRDPSAMVKVVGGMYAGESCFVREQLPKMVRIELVDSGKITKIRPENLESFEATRDQGKPTASTAAAAAATPAAHASQIIETDLEVLDSTTSATTTTTRSSFNALSSTPSAQRRFSNTRRTPPKSASLEEKRSAKGALAAATRSGKGITTSKSSTMPGFKTRNVNLSGRRRAHRDGLRIAEQRSGKDLKKIINSRNSVSARTKANSEAMYRGSASVPDSLIAYAEQIHRATDRITPAEEIELGTETQEAIRLQNVYSDLEEQLRREPSDAEWCAAAGKISSEALNAALEDGMQAKNRLVEANLRLVQGVVNLYIRNGLGSQYNAGDLMQEGTMALIRAAEKFEPERGLRFSTYAMYWIRAAVKRSQISQSRVIQVPQRLHETHKRVLKVQKELKGELGRPPTSEELALASDLSQLQLGRCLKAMAQQCFSLDATLKNRLKPGTGGDRKDTMYDIVSGKFEDDQYRRTQQRLMKDSLISSIRSVLSPHEVDLLLLRYGLMDERTLPHGFAGPLTIAEVSRLVGLKPDKVRRMINLMG